MNNLKLVLGLAKRFRRCPPAAIKNAPDHQIHYQKHLAICPYCQSDETDELAEFEAVAERLGDAVAPGDAETERNEPLAGELRLIHPACAQWRDEYYYNPPLILVLECIEEIPGAVLAAQTYYDTTMAGPGDLILSAEQTNGLDLFIEPWNIYTLSSDYLGPMVSRVTDDIIAAVKRLDRNPAAIPPWAIHPLPMLENDPRIYFRQLEVEVGYTFAVQAADKLMKMVEAAAEVFFRRSPDAVITQIQSLEPAISWQQPPESAGAAFLTAQFGEDQLRMAAADTEASVCTANYIELEQERVVSVSPVYAQIKTDTRKDHFRAISGMIQEDDPTADTELLAGWQTPAGKIHLPERIEWYPEHGFFYVEFTHLPDDFGQLRMAVVRYLQKCLRII